MNSRPRVPHAIFAARVNFVHTRAEKSIADNMGGSLRSNATVRGFLPRIIFQFDLSWELELRDRTRSEIVRRFRRPEQ